MPRRGHTMKRVSTLSLVIAGVLVAGCSSSSKPWWYGSGPTSCGPPALARVAGQVKDIGSCSGSFWLPAMKVTLHVGEAVDLHMTEEGSGPSGSQLVPGSPLPDVSGSSVLGRTITDKDKAAATYKAEHPGHVVLVTPGRCILDGHMRSSCPLIDVRVIR
jgi:hypothetical protein